MYEGKRLDTDEVAKAHNLVNELTKKLEKIKWTTGDDHLLFKWGTLKSWNMNSDKGKVLLKEYFEIGSSMSAMLQKDTDRQREIILELIDECDGVIQNDWDGEYYTKAKAKKYITTYKN